MDARTDGQRENSIPPTNKVCGGYNYVVRISGEYLVDVMGVCQFVEVILRSRVCLMIFRFSDLLH